MALMELEKFSLNHDFMRAVASQEESTSGVVGFLGWRAVVFIVSPFSAAADLVIHSILAAGKFVIAVLIGPFHFIAKHCCGCKCEPLDNLLLSSLTHLFIVVKTAVFIPVVMVTGSFSPRLGQCNADIGMIIRQAKGEEESDSEWDEKPNKENDTKFSSNLSTNPFDN